MPIGGCPRAAMLIYRTKKSIDMLIFHFGARGITVTQTHSRAGRAAVVEKYLSFGWKW